MANAPSSISKSGPYRVRLLAHPVIASITIALFAPCAIAAFGGQKYGLGLTFLALVAVGVLIFLMSGYFELDDESIMHHCALGRFRMLWRDVRQMEQGSGVLLLRGDASRFMLPLGGWSGPEKREAWQVLVRRIQATGIVPMPSNTAAYKWHWNARLRGDRIV